ncbi:MAG: tetratricopeptide repeat protein [Rhodospirillaceae bacterium]|nr:tetratricopeptide repeat protein [Rhodospirillaceae bacterium]MBT5564738.1 tetratricopeptide repeat protein [Rhodospirillaceae bacterium]MBT6090129.1 tetratricopeptide repeat protein [Rhodospirillaceae bacterium]MBT6962378.1 tetratricopeptide repeat protein [Rhodospirillaceae bacterium]
MPETPDQPNAPITKNGEDLFAACIRRGEDFLAVGALDEAMIHFEKACRIAPTSALPLYKLGTIQYRKTENEKAIDALVAANRLDPDNPDILNILGAAYGRSDQPKESLAIFRRVFELDPSHAVAAMNCGRLLLSIGRTEEAEAWLTKAATIRPKHGETLRLLTEARLAVGQPRLAIVSGESAILSDPENAGARLALGQAYLSVRKLQAAHEQLSLFLQQKPNHPEGLYFLAETEEKNGRVDVARALYRRVMELEIDPEFKTLIGLKTALTLPVINKSSDAIAKYRAIIDDALYALPRGPVKDAYTAGGFTNFYLAYHGENDRDLQERIAGFYLECCPDLATIAPHVGKSSKREKFRVGILSSFLRGHTVGYLCRGMIEHLDRDRFEIILLRSPVLPLEDPVAPIIAAMADRVIDLPDDLARARAIVAAEETDLIYFPEIGMEDLVYFLAFARSAPVQVMGWGHPVTSGIPNMDGFLSVAAMEPEESHNHYSEALIELDGLSICVPEPSMPSVATDRATFGMDRKTPAYLCAQSLYKIHPDFDSIAVALLEKDPDAHLYFLTIHTHADEVFLRRLEKSMGANIHRVKILPRVRSRDFTALLASADVLLDIPHWSGGKTSLESLITGTPIVHWPGAFMRGRHTLAFYKRMDVMDCVVDSADAYVETAYRLVHDQVFRTSVRERIRERAPLLFNDRSAITEISDVFEKLIVESRQDTTEGT